MGKIGNMLRSLFVSVITLLISTLVCVVIAEFALRPFYPSSGTSFKYRVPHEVLGWSLEPNADYINYLPEGAVPVAYNAEGWRDVSEHNDNAKLKVAVLGDSFMEGYSVALEDSFHRQLAAQLSSDGTTVSSFNYGVGGYGTLQEYLVFRDYASKQSPDVVLLGLYLGNDLRNNTQALNKQDDSIKASRPFLTSATGNWELTDTHYDAALARYHESKNDWWGNFTERSALKRAWRTLWFQIKQNSQQPDRVEATSKRKIIEEFGPHMCNSTPEVDESWAITERLLSRLNIAVAAKGARLIVFSVPAYHEIDSAVIAQLTAAAPQDASLCLAEAPGYQKLAAVTQSLGIEYLDLMPSFKAASNGDGAVLFNKSDRHWNAGGHSLAANLVADSIRTSVNR